MREGMILNLQRMSTEDGPGIRTTVFFKGCTLACKWCHNPESIDFARELEWFAVKCIGCNMCIQSCKNRAIAMTESGLVRDEELCQKCLQCVETCPANATETKGEVWTSQQLFDELIKDRAYFEHGGGVTLSGGEVLAQADFAAEVLGMLKEAGIHTAVDTCGHVKRESIEKVLDVADMFLYDIKVMDADVHRQYTGQDNTKILDNYRWLSGRIREAGKVRLWVRTPLIPSVTDTEGNVRAIAEMLEESGDALERWELLAFNNLCEAKYDRLNKEWTFKGVKKQSDEKLREISNILKDYKKLDGKAHVTGTASAV
ncbi:MAG: glycyl-radical enzyme activating protein [Eubacteriales bacterium]